jgi:predicted dehydrogenase
MIKLALIGKGRWGQNYIKEIRQGIKGISLPDENILDIDYLDYLSKLDADGVIITSPTSTHFQVAKDLIKTGFKRLLIEKPVTLTLSEALQLQKIAKQKGVLIMVGHIQLYDEAIIKMEEELSLVGKVRKMSYDGLKSPVRKDATVIQDWGPHPSYLFMHFLSKTPKGVAVEKGRFDNVLLTYDFGNITATAKIGWTHPQKRRLFKIEGEKGKLIFDGSKNEKKLTFLGSSGNKRLIEFSDSTSPLKNEILEFVDMVKNGGLTRSPLSQGVKVMRILDFAEKFPF